MIDLKLSLIDFNVDIFTGRSNSIVKIPILDNSTLYWQFWKMLYCIWTIILQHCPIYKFCDFLGKCYIVPKNFNAIYTIQILWFCNIVYSNFCILQHFSFIIPHFYNIIHSNFVFLQYYPTLFIQILCLATLYSTFLQHYLFKFCFF